MRDVVVGGDIPLRLTLLRMESRENETLTKPAAPRLRDPRCFEFSSASQPEKLDGPRRILIVEDNFIIAHALARNLRAQGAEPIGPAARVKDALPLIDERIDGAVLDVKLGGEMVYPIINLLRARNVPVVFVTGYDDGAIEPRYANVPRVQKPVTGERLMQLLFG
jgi:CheY-like chemotaxis protein